MLEDEHSSSMGEESLNHLWQILCKYYVAKSSEEQKEKMKKKYDEKKIKVRKKGRIKKENKERKRENEKELK
jgi:hypothetical protein